MLKGSYPTQPNKVFFELKYVIEDESWKLVGINVQVKPASDAPPKKGKEKKAKDSERRRGRASGGRLTAFKERPARSRASGRNRR